MPQAQVHWFRYQLFCGRGGRFMEGGALDFALLFLQIDQALVVSPQSTGRAGLHVTEGRLWQVEWRS